MIPRAFPPAEAARLATCDPQLQRLFQAVLKQRDCTILEGGRSIELERVNIARGTSKLVDPLKCKHVITATRPMSRAVDAGPYPIVWSDQAAFRAFGGFVKGIASQLEIQIRWGGDWDGDWDFHNQTFNDLPHFELVE